MRRFWLLAGLVCLLLAGLSASPASAEAPPSGVQIQTYATGRAFPVAMAFAPDGRLFYTEKGGFQATASPRVITLQGTPGALTERVWLQLTGIDAQSERGLLGIALDPQFASNGYVYLFYTNRTPLENRVVRYTEQRTGAGTGTADPSSAVILMTFPIPVGSGSNHNGGNIHFGADGYLYVTHGELGAFRSAAQQLNQAIGKIHRINPANGSAPSDNPFYDDGNPAVGNDDRIWSYGHRNSFDFTFDTYDPPGLATPSNHLLATENGPQCNDEILRVAKGYNHRWPNDQDCPAVPLPATGPTANDPAIPALAYYSSTIAPTGIVVHTGHIGAWRGDVLFCATNNQRLYRADLNSARTAFTTAPQTIDLPLGGCSLDVENGVDGALYFAIQDTIYRARVCRNFAGAAPVGVDDIQYVAQRWGLSPGDPGYDANTDLNGDGSVNIIDVMIVVGTWNSSCS